MKRLCILGVLVALASFTSLSWATISQKGNVRVKVDGKLEPARLPRTAVAPIAVTVDGAITTTDQSLVPRLDSLSVALNRHGRIDYQGLPSCRYDQIQPGTSSHALAACRPSLVGSGSFTAAVTLSGQQPYPTKGKLLVFYGRRAGKPVLYGHLYAPHPFASSFIIVFKLSTLPGGTYGTVLDAKLPAALGAWGRLTGLDMTLSRRYRSGGQQRSFISSGCPAPEGFPAITFPLARTTFDFAGGLSFSSVLTRSCKAEG